MDELNKRIVEIMVRYNHSKSSFAGTLEVSLPLITHITSGRNKPGIELLQKVLTRFNEVDPIWLMLGEGQMLKQQPAPPDPSPVLARIGALESMVNQAIMVNNTVVQYHKLLMDEILHLQEMDIQIQHASIDLEKLKAELDKVKDALRDI